MLGEGDSSSLVLDTFGLKYLLDFWFFYACHVIVSASLYISVYCLDNTKQAKTSSLKCKNANKCKVTEYDNSQITWIKGHECFCTSKVIIKIPNDLCNLNMP